MLTDHPLCPVCESEIRLFSEGFVIEKFDSTRMPLLVSMKTHVECLWVVDSFETKNQASLFIPPLLDAFPLNSSDSAGLLVVFRLKVDYELSLDDKEDILQYNPLERVLPFINLKNIADEKTRFPKHIALFVPGNSRSSNAFNTAAAAWRISSRIYDLSEYRGSNEVCVHDKILKAFLMIMDKNSNVIRSILTSLNVITTAKYFLQNPLFLFPGLGNIAMR
jgi:hypothetical protein